MVSNAKIRDVLKEVAHGIENYVFRTYDYMKWYPHGSDDMDPNMDTRVFRRCAKIIGVVSEWIRQCARTLGVYNACYDYCSGVLIDPTISTKVGRDVSIRLILLHMIVFILRFVSFCCM